MNRFILNVMLIIVSTLICSCKSTPTTEATGKNQITLSNLEKIPLRSKKEDVEGFFGKPNKVEDDKDFFAWVYSDTKGIERATLVFNKSTGQLGAKNWDVEDGDPEQKIEIALKRFPSARFRKREREIVNPHIAPDEYFYEDPSQNLSIEVRFTRNEVSNINWALPENREKPKKCIKFQKDNGLITCKPD